MNKHKIKFTNIFLNYMCLIGSIDSIEKLYNISQTSFQLYSNTGTTIGRFYDPNICTAIDEELWTKRFDLLCQTIKAIISVL